MKFALLLAPILLSSCSHLSRHPSSAQTPAPEAKAPAEVADSVELDWSALEKVDEDGKDAHALVEDTESDERIAATEGADVDQVEGVDEEDARPARPFLKKVRTKRVKFWVDYFTLKQRDRFQRFLNNGSMYRPIIERIFEEQGVPKELFFVGLIESGYYLGAHSRAAAVGPWQFIRGTGIRYGLATTREFDERRDIFKATVAAAQYFKDLHNIFSSWELALAAYNAGEYGIIRRITRHKSRDFYELSRRGALPKETANYVPKVLAAMHVVENAEKYGFTLPNTNARFWQKTKLINAPKGASLERLADRLNLSPVLLSKLNPELRAPHTPRGLRGAYQLRVPATKHTEWMETLVADLPMGNPRYKEIEALRDRMLNNSVGAPVAVQAPVRAPAHAPSIHRVRRGETLASIARRNHISLSSLAKLNRLTVRSKVRVGQRLKLDRTVIATTDLKSSAPVRVIGVKAVKKVAKGTRAPQVRRGHYVVRRGEGLSKIAAKFGMKLQELARMNKIKRGRIYPGQRLVVNL